MNLLRLFYGIKILSIYNKFYKKWCLKYYNPSLNNKLCYKIAIFNEYNWYLSSILIKKNMNNLNYADVVYHIVCQREHLVRDITYNLYVFPN